MSSGKIQVWIEADKLIGAWLNVCLMEETASGEERKREEEGEDSGRKSCNDPGKRRTKQAQSKYVSGRAVTRVL